MNANGAVAIQTSKIVSTFDIEKPEVRNRLFRIRGNQGLTLFDKLESLGYARGIAADSTTQYEEDWIHQTIHVGVGGITTVDAPTGVYSFILSVAAGTSDVLAGSIIAPYPTVATLPLSYAVPVQAFDRLLFPENGAIVTVQSVTQTAATTTFTVLIKLADLNFAFTPGNYPAGTELVNQGNAWAEGATQPVGQLTKPLVDHAYVQIVKKSFEWTGTQATNQPWFTELEGVPNIGDGYYIKGQHDCDYELKLAISTALFTERPTTNSIIDTNTRGGEPVKSTEGLIPYIGRRGNVVPYVSGSFGMGIFNYAINKLDAELAPDYVGFWVGSLLDQEINSTLRAYFQNTNITYVQQQMVQDLFGGDEGKAVSVGFNQLAINDFTFVISKMKEFSHPKIYGCPGYGYNMCGIMTPIATKPDKKTGDPLPYIGMIYKKLGPYSRKAEVWGLYGAHPGEKVLQEDLNKLCMRSHIGAEHVGGNQMILFDAANIV